MVSAPMLVVVKTSCLESQYGKLRALFFAELNAKIENKNAGNHISILPPGPVIVKAILQLI